MVRRAKAVATEVDAYVYIKGNLKALGWDARNPERSSGAGQVYTQNECLAHPEIKRFLGLERPENIVKVTETDLWVIEAKRTHGQLDQALAEAEEYARKINQSSTLCVVFITGVAGNDLDSFLMRTRMLVGGKFVPVTINNVEITGLLKQSDCESLLHSGTGNIENPPIDERLFLARADHVNEILHLGAVNPHQRASVMAALLLSKLSDTGPNVNERIASVLIGDINNRVGSILRTQGKAGFQDYIKISLPSTEDNHRKFRKALVDTLQELNNLNIRSAMNSGADWLGAFYEVFLKYASWAQDLGIVLTPRHITRYVAEVMDIQPNDIVYDPTCGTGGFLVAAFDSVKQKANEAQVNRFKQYGLFGVEQDAGVAALAVVNMIFRGDGKNNIVEGNCFAKFLEPVVVRGTPTAQYSEIQSDNPPITKVMMNPPFALKRSDEKEFKFVEQALHQMQDGGLLFTVLPYSAMVRPGSYLNWRKNLLLPYHTLLSVVTFPDDLFYPVGVTSVGVFIKKGIPHPPAQKVLWIRALNDGLLKSKGKRLPSPRASDDLVAVRDLLRAFLHNPQHPATSVDQFIKATPIDLRDGLLELVPEAYLDQAEPTHEMVIEGLENRVREKLAFLVKINRAVLRADLLVQRPMLIAPPVGWKRYKVTELFNLKRGSFHSIANLDPGTYHTVSRVSTDNGLVGFYERPGNIPVWSPKTITVSSVTGDAFVQPISFIATDNVVLCILKDEYAHISLNALMFIELMLDAVKWRYSYGRQCYKTKFAVTEIVLPCTGTGDIDWEYMETVVENTPYWPLVKASFE
ncbi:MAG: N-6 DNA methylase [Ktedonobacteraceae bacterium]